MTEIVSTVPQGFGPILRSSPVLDALGGFMSRGADASLEIGMLVGPNHLNARGALHGGVTATLLDVGIGYMLVARSGGRRRVTARLTVDYRSSAKAGEWLQVHLDDIREDGRKTHATARLMSAERLVAQAEVLFIDASVPHT
jgi:uncharacterized protein (TIGR00369 family)